MTSTSLVPTPVPGALIKNNAIMQVIDECKIEADLCEEDFESEKERWASGGTAADMAVVAALTAVQDGHTLVDLGTVIARGGKSPSYTNSKMPSLTLAPAFAKEVSMRVWHDGEMTLKAGRGRHSWKLEIQSGYTFDRKNDAISYNGVATVPGMPPEIRKIAKPDHLLLWEPEWRKVGSQIQRPPRDPALLEQLSGNLYVVLATWDLTPLEAAALAV